MEATQEFGHHNCLPRLRNRLFIKSIQMFLGVVVILDPADQELHHTMLDTDINGSSHTNLAPMPGALQNPRWVGSQRTISAM